MARASTTPTTRTDPSALPSRIGRLLGEVRWFLLLAVTIAFLIILLSYNRADPGFTHASQVDEIRNLGGRPTRAAAGGGGNAAAEAAAAAAARAAAGGPPVPGSVRYRVSDRRLWYSWAYIDALRKVARSKLIVKGIMDPEDARLAAHHDVDAVVVSNHGGRQLDGAPATIDVLPAIVDAVGDRLEVLFDSGITSGQDLLKALALGARAGLIGKAFLYGLGADGEAGVTQAIEIIRRELSVSMALTGQCDARHIAADVLLPRK